MREVRLDPAVDRTYYYWHVFVPGIRPGQLDAYRVEGPCDPSTGMRVDPTKLLLDPYGRAIVVPEGYSRGEAWRPGDNAGTAMKNVVVDRLRVQLGRRHAAAAAVVGDGL